MRKSNWIIFFPGIGVEKNKYLSCHHLGMIGSKESPWNDLYEVLGKYGFEKKEPHSRSDMTNVGGMIFSYIY